jgi:hypothetical protein
MADTEIAAHRPPSTLPIWIFGMIFLFAGVIMTSCGANMAYGDAQWNDAVRTKGVVILTEWRNQNNESQMHITYGYKDPAAQSIYHNTAIIARRYGKLNLQPGAPVVVLYRRDDHSKSRLEMETSIREWLPLVFLGVVETIVGGAFVAHCVKRLRAS